eukprot:scaffold63534_cov15-Phaeocystis_antarctica.AAC.1
MCSPCPRALRADRGSSSRPPCPRRHLRRLSPRRPPAAALATTAGDGRRCEQGGRQGGRQGGSPTSL